MKELKTIKKINNILDKAEKRKEKLAARLTTLQADEKALFEAVQDDFNASILDEREPDKKLSSDLEKLRGEIENTSFQLSQIDAVVKNEIEKQKEAVQEERKEYLAEKGEEFRQFFDELNEAKLAYLSKVIEYKNKHTEFERDFNRTFRSISKRVGLREIDPSYQYQLHAFQRMQVDGHYTPMLTPDEIREAFVEGKLTRLTEKNKAAFKK
ncbi:hypothetical protein P4489_06665 [Heyndrickxia sporothermodurans]|uniref:hypothetical protein n=1 Tax=Heyndrickxia sporothermodurans TaxID=46224 RepID=UPI002E1DBAC4|nr:hypothetical protein [Heyndrickxia sporothermodurans]